MGLLGTIANRLGYTKAEEPEITNLPPVLTIVGEQSTWGSVTQPGIHGAQQQYYSHSSAVFQCVSMVARAVAMAQFGVFKRVEENGNIRWEAVDHPFEKVLERPHPWLTRYEIMYALAASLKLTGNHYWYLWPNALGEPGWLIPLRSDRMKIVPHKTKFISHYEYEVNGEVVKLRADEVVHFRNYHPASDYEGMSDIEAAAYAAASDVGMQKFNKAFFDNFARPDVALVMPEGTTPEKKKELETKFAAKYKGPEKAHGVMLLTGGLDIKDLTMKPKDAEFIEGRRLNREDIFGVFGIPLGKVEKETTRANAEMADYTFKNETIMPLLTSIQEVFTVHLLPEYREEGKFFARFYDVVPKNRELELQEWEQKIKLQARTPNEWRAADGLPPVDWGDDPWTPPGMTGMRALEAPIVLSSMPVDEKSFQRERMKTRDALRREVVKQFGIQLRAVLDVLKQEKKVVSVDKIFAALDASKQEFAHAMVPHLEEAFRTGRNLGEAKGLSAGGRKAERKDIDPATWALYHAGGKIVGITETSRKLIGEVISEAIREKYTLAWIEKALIDLFGDWQKVVPGYRSRAMMIAATETARAYNSGSLHGYADMGFTKVNVYDGGGPNSCEICNEIGGQVWTVQEALSKPLEHPSCIRAFGPYTEW